MSTENSTASGGSTGTSDQIPDEIDSCAICDSSLERRSQHSSTNRQIILFGCAECRVGAVAIVDQRGPLTERCTGRLDRAQSRAMTGLSVYRVAAFITDDLPTGRYTVKRVDEHQFRIGLPETASPWDVLRLADSLSVGPLSAERIDGAVLITDARWSSADVEDHPDVVADGGTLPTSMIDESPLGSVGGRPTSGGSTSGDERSESAGDPFTATDDDEPRTERAKSEDMDVSLLQKGGIYEVHSASDSYYEVDVAAEECNCPDTADRCKHLRRVELELEAGFVPRPDGRLP